MYDLPNPAHPEHHVRAWLTPPEADLLDAAECPDLRSFYTVSAGLSEDYDERGKKRRRPAMLPDGVREAREAEAQRLFGARVRMCKIGPSALAMIAQLRRENHYLRAGLPVPPIPKEG